MATRKRITGTVYERITAQIEVKENGCWWWTGLLSDQGYARIRINRRTVKTHRVFYELVKGPIPDGLDLDHTCHDPKTCDGGPTCLHRRCINPDHLEPVPKSVNRSKDRSVGNVIYMRSRKPSAACTRGHEYTDETTIYYRVPISGKIKRRCLLCRWEQSRVTKPRKNIELYDKLYGDRN